MLKLIPSFPLLDGPGFLLPANPTAACLTSIASKLITSSQLPVWTWTIWIYCI